MMTSIRSPLNEDIANLKRNRFRRPNCLVILKYSYSTRTRESAYLPSSVLEDMVCLSHSEGNGELLEQGARSKRRKCILRTTEGKSKAYTSGLAEFRHITEKPAKFFMTNSRGVWKYYLSEHNQSSSPNIRHSMRSDFPKTPSKTGVVSLSFFSFILLL